MTDYLALVLFAAPPVAILLYGARQRPEEGPAPERGPEVPDGFTDVAGGLLAALVSLPLAGILLALIIVLLLAGPSGLALGVLWALR